MPFATGTWILPGHDPGMGTILARDCVFGVAPLSLGVGETRAILPIDARLT